MDHEQSSRSHKVNQHTADKSEGASEDCEMEGTVGREILKESTMAAERRLPFHAEDEDVERAMAKIFDAEFETNAGHATVRGETDDKIAHAKGSMEEAVHRIEAKLDALLSGMVQSKSVKAMVAPRQMKEDADEEDDSGITIEEAVRGKRYVAGSVCRWRTDGAFGFIKTNGKDVFFHKNSLQGSLDGIVGQRVMLQLDADPSRGVDKYRATIVQRETAYVAEKARERASSAVVATVRAAEEAARSAVASRDAVETAELASMRSKWNDPGLLEPPGFASRRPERR